MSHITFPLPLDMFLPSTAMLYVFPMSNSDNFVIMLLTMPGFSSSLSNSLIFLVFTKYWELQNLLSAIVDHKNLCTLNLEACPWFLGPGINLKNLP